MPEEFFRPDDPTEWIPPSSWPPQKGQGKLVIGSLQDAPKSSQRRPYPPQRGLTSPSPSSRPTKEQLAQSATKPNNVRPDQTLQMMTKKGNSEIPRLKRPSSFRKGRLIAGLVVLLLVAFLFITVQRVWAFGSTISTQGPLSTQTWYMNTGDRVNLLVMGYGGGAHDGANLTDSMLVVSLLPPSRHTSLVSVPRDLWIQANNAKINTVYQVGSNNGQDRSAGGDAAAQQVSQVTGLDVKYWMTINFTGFREVIDAIGGIDVYVPDSFKANYPKNDDPTIDASWITVKFTQGNQHMDGETAIRYARARYVLDKFAEGTDFARSARQQIIIKAALAKVKQISTWPLFLNAMTALQNTIYTNLSFADLMGLTSKMDLNDPHTAHIGLNNQNVLVDDQSNDGQAILRPRNGEQAIKDYVQKHLYP